MPAKKKGGCCSGKKKPAESSEVPVLEPLPTQEITPINKVEEQGGCQCCSSNRTEADPVDGIPLLHYPQLTCSHRRWSSSTGGHQFPLCMWHLPRMLLGNMLPGLQVSRNVTKTRRGTYYALLSRTRLIPRHTAGRTRLFSIFFFCRGRFGVFRNTHSVGLAVKW
jgi:hypothetical protein